MARRLDSTKRDQWHRRFLKFDSSDLTVAQFCQREHVSQASFYYWSKRVRGSRRSKTIHTASADDRPLAARNEQGDDCVEIVVDDAIRVRMSAAEPAAVASLIRQLQAASAASSPSPAGSRFQRIELTA